MSTRPIVGGDLDVWGGKVNLALDELDQKAGDASALAASAHALALEAGNINAGIAAQARNSAQEAQGWASAAAGDSGRARSARIRAEAAEQAAWNIINSWTPPPGGGGGSFDEIDGGTPSSAGSPIIDGGTP